MAKPITPKLLRKSFVQIGSFTITFILLGGCILTESIDLNEEIEAFGATAASEIGGIIETEANQLIQALEDELATQASKLAATLLPNKYKRLFIPPYNACLGSSSSINSPASGSEDIIEVGFGSISFECNESDGTFNNQVLLFGGKNGNVLKPPNYDVKVISGIEIVFEAPFTGEYNIQAILSINSRTGASAGAGTIIPEFRDLVLVFMLPTSITAFGEIAQAIILQPQGIVRTQAFLYLENDSLKNQTLEVVGARALGASYPLPPWSQIVEFTNEEIILEMSGQFTAGDVVFIGVGIETTSFVKGWVITWWNPFGLESSIVKSISITKMN